MVNTLIAKFGRPDVGLLLATSGVCQRNVWWFTSGPLMAAVLIG